MSEQEPCFLMPSVDTRWQQEQQQPEESRCPGSERGVSCLCLRDSKGTWDTSGTLVVQGTMSAFSSDTSEALLRGGKGGQAAALAPPTAPEVLRRVFEMDRSAAFVRLHSLRTVALQFPDAMLGDAARVVWALEEESGALCFVLGDSTYGSCCVDEVAAQHAGAEGLIHYGHACLSPARLLPVLRVFGRLECDASRCLAAFRGVFPSTAQRVVVLADVQYEHALDDLENILGPEYPHVRFARVESQPADQTPKDVPPAEDPCRTDGTERAFGRLLLVEAGSRLEDYSIFYIGRESITLTNFMMSWNNCEFFTYDPGSGESQRASASTSRLVKRRYYLVERARDASFVGILVGTLGVAGFLEIIEQLKRALARAGKRWQVFVVGKPNPAKLANFPEIDVFVLVACPENSLLESAEFYQPIVTPFEMEVACNRQRLWTGSFVSDFRELLPGYPHHVPLPESHEEEGTEGDVSLITGAIRCQSRGVENPMDVGPTDALLVRGHNLQVASSQSAAGYLAARDWQGLDPRLGQTRVSRVQQGRRGVAIAYEDEHKSAAT